MGFDASARLVEHFVYTDRYTRPISGRIAGYGKDNLTKEVYLPGETDTSQTPTQNITQAKPDGRFSGNDAASFRKVRPQHCY